MTEQSDSYSNLDFEMFQQNVIEEFRANSGRVGGMFEGSRLLLLTTVGARTGLRRTHPLSCLDLDGVRAVVASAMGGPRNPAWYFNVRSNPMVTVETGIDTYEAVARTPTGIERERLFAKVVECDAGFGDYQRRTSRVIPVVTLQRVETGTAWAKGMGDFLVESHNWLRTELAGIRDQVDRIAAGKDQTLRTSERPLGAQLQQHCLQFCSALNEHHDGEDGGAFPVLAQRFPGLAPVIDRLVGEHEVVHELQDQLRSVIEGYRPGEADPARLRAQIDRLSRQLENHFTYEEATLVTALNSLGPAPEIP